MPELAVHVVVVAYGPAARTKRAVRRARRLAGPTGSTTVVPASNFAAHACRNLPGAVTEPGTNAIRKILENETHEFVLILHDDVFLAKGAIEHFEAALDETHRFVVPYSNDVGMDHFGGSLPPVDHIDDQTLIRRAKPLAGLPVRAVRPACLFARPGDLRRLASRPLVEPNLRIDDIELGLIAAPVMAAHDGSCAARLGPPETAGGGPLLVAAMIVRDEEETLPDCLDSIRLLVDRVEVCDTGSLDGTIRIAEAAGASVIRRVWRDDFGWARNEGLERCRDAEFVLAIDADDRVICEDPEHLRRYLATYAAEYDAFSVAVTSHDGATSSTNRSARILRASNVEFQGAVHEVPIWKDAPFKPVHGASLDLLRIEHIGYRPEIALSKDKGQRNLNIARASYESDQNFKTAVEYARSLVSASQSHQEAIPLFREARLLSAGGPLAVRAYVAALLAQSLVEVGESDEAFCLAEEALREVPADDTAAEAAAKACGLVRCYERFLALAAEVEGKASVRPVSESPHGRRLFEEMRVIALMEVGRWKEAQGLLMDRMRLGQGFESWTAVLEVAARGRGVAELLTPIIREYPEVAVLARSSHEIAPIDTALMCAEYLESGGRSNELALLGVVSAIVADQEVVVHRMAPYLVGFTSPQIERLAEKAASRGLADSELVLRSLVS